jgi:hypothetical protein
MAGTPRTYDARKMLVAVADRRITGFGDGDFLSLVPSSNLFESYVGTDGEVSRAATNDRRVTATLTLAQTSAANVILSELAELDRVSANGAGVSRVLFQDLGGGATGTKVEGLGWVQRLPDLGFGREVGTRAWAILLDAETYRVGGNG